MTLVNKTPKIKPAPCQRCGCSSSAPIIMTTSGETFHLLDSHCIAALEDFIGCIAKILVEDGVFDGRRSDLLDAVKRLKEKSQKESGELQEIRNAVSKTKDALTSLDERHAALQARTERVSMAMMQVALIANTEAAAFLKENPEVAAGGAEPLGPRGGASLAAAMERLKETSAEAVSGVPEPEAKADPPRETSAGDVRSYVTDDQDVDKDQHRLDVFQGRNGDWYASIAPSSLRSSPTYVRITTSGTRHHKMPSAMRALWEAMAAETGPDEAPPLGPRGEVPLWWRGSVSDLATDLAELLTAQQIHDLGAELQRVRRAAGYDRVKPAQGTTSSGKSVKELEAVIEKAIEMLENYHRFSSADKPQHYLRNVLRGRHTSDQSQGSPSFARTEEQRRIVFEGALQHVLTMLMKEEGYCHHGCGGPCVQGMIRASLGE